LVPVLFRRKSLCSDLQNTYLSNNRFTYKKLSEFFDMKLYTGHVLEVLKQLPEESVQCVVTSPPYYSLRKYAGVQEVVWGGVKDCEHKWSVGCGVLEREESPGVGAKQEKKADLGRFCTFCSAWRGAFGLEPTPELYIEHSMMILDALWRVLRKDGVVWWNLGDSYAGSGSPGGDFKDGKGGDEYLRPYNRKGSGLKPKDLCLIPFRFALAAQERGWWVRSDIIWSKPNPMPESVRDRPTRSHEYIFLLTKSQRYYWDQMAVREKYTKSTVKRLSQPTFHQQTGGEKDYGRGINKNRSCRRALENLKKKQDLDNGRNIRSVWTFPTRPYPEAHFAVFPPELPRRCILASTPVKACPNCGAGWERVVERRGSVSRAVGKSAIKRTLGLATAFSGYEDGSSSPVSITKGFRPSCSCPDNDGSGKAVVLDPFSGSGTTVQVAEKLGREGWGIDISHDYRELAEKRLSKVVRYRSLDECM
jgi:DNA modification methylase